MLAPLRRGREVAWTPEFMGFGNLLLLFLWAHERRAQGSPAYVLVRPALRPWLDAFPGLRALAVTSDQVRFTDQRMMPWSAAARERGAGFTDAPHQPIDVARVERLVRDHVLPGSPVLRPGSSGQDSVLVVNVRRGDYYSDPEIRAQYGFDVEAYLRVAVPAAVHQAGGLTGVRVVSDGIDWCREHLAWVAELVPEVEYGDPRDSAVEQFATIARARHLVITNSTFSYWAAFVSNALHGNNLAEVWAPDFFDRTQNGGRTWLVDSRWSIVPEPQDGWGT